MNLAIADVIRRKGPAAAMGFLMPLVVFAVLLLVEGVNPFSLYGTMWQSAFGSASGFAQVVVKTTPFLLTSLAAALPARVGLVNVGGEGQLYVGALVTTWLAVTWLDSTSIYLALPLMVVVGAMGGALWASIAALLHRFVRISETLTTLLLNYVAADLIGFAVNGPLKDPGSLMYPVSPPLPQNTLLPTLGNSNFNTGIFLSLALVLIVWFVLDKTRLGFRMKIVGRNPTAAIQGGISVRRVQFWTLIVAGAIAGIAGMLVVSGDDGQLYASTGANYGYFGFLASWIAWNRPLWAIPASVLIAAISVAGDTLQITSGLPGATVQILMSLILFGILAAGRGLKHERNA